VITGQQLNKTQHSSGVMNVLQSLWYEKNPFFTKEGTIPKKTFGFEICSFWPKIRVLLGWSLFTQKRIRRAAQMKK
jgi:hypothetical protein